ncbi:hypothetical protein RhiirA5_384114, partial [Rhizophagus irregularis]
MSDLKIINISSDSSEIQYSLGKPSGAHSNTFCPYLGAKCKDKKKTCQGEYLAAIKTKCCYNNYTCNGKPVDDKKCFTIIPSASKKKECPIPHVKDGKIELLPLVKIGCNIIFHKYEPLDLKSCPYIVMVVKNTHSHPPLPPHRIPGHLQEN